MNMPSSDLEHFPDPKRMNTMVSKHKSGFLSVKGLIRFDASLLRFVLHL